MTLIQTLAGVDLFFLDKTKKREQKATSVNNNIHLNTKNLLKKLLFTKFITLLGESTVFVMHQGYTFFGFCFHL